ncbi:uncharacterized protein TNCV_2458691 [Trichonephila clavipes]|nr:uncharacterized protein TNCV_2458691 [Trichonephila clavipes]
MVHDEALPPFCAHVRDWRDMACSCNWIGLGAPVLLPPRSPDLTLSDFFPMGSSQEFGVSRGVDFPNGLIALLYAACISVDTTHWCGIHSTACSSLPRYARRTL